MKGFLSFMICLVPVMSIAQVDAGPDLFLCINNAIRLSGNPAGGTWSGTGMQGDIFYVPSKGSYTVTYSVSISGVDMTDTRTITINDTYPFVYAEPNLLLNKTDGAVELLSPAGLPSEGVWSGPSVSGGFFTPTMVGSHVLTYTYTSGAGCSSSAYRIATVVNK